MTGRTPRLVLQSGARAPYLVLSAVLLLLSASCFGGRRQTTPVERPADADAPAAIGRAADAAELERPLGDSLAPRADSAATPDSAPARGAEPADSMARARIDTAAAVRADAPNKEPTVPKPDVSKAPEKKPPKDCLLDFSESPPESRLLSFMGGDNTRITFIGGGMVAFCQGDPERIRADSAEQFESTGMMNLFGNVVFERPGKLQVTAPFATYFAEEQKLVAFGGVVATDLPTGSTFRGPSIEYYRAGSLRDVARMVAPQRPALRLIERDSAGNPRPPVDIEADRMEDVGDTLLTATGRVIVQRENVRGEGDTATFNKITEAARLMRKAFIMSRDTARPFRLDGDTIDLFTRNRELERVVAVVDAKATGRDVALRGDRVAIQLDSQQVSRSWAWGPSRAFAETGSQSLEADSIDIRMPQQQVQEMHAVGRAVAFTTPDTLKIKDPERDILRGDTVVAVFDTLTTAPDTAPETVLQQVVATGSASALYQLPAKEGRDFVPSISYVRGGRITVRFDRGDMQSVRVDSQAVGVYLEPQEDTTGKGRDSVANRADTSTTSSRQTSTMTDHESEPAVADAKPASHATPPPVPAEPLTGSVLAATGLVKAYRGRKVVNDVAVSLRQGEIVGLLGPNGAGKTTTFYMIVGLIAPLAGTISLDGEDITKMPMYKRAQRGIGYLAQEPSIFRKLTVEENILAILETLDLSAADRSARLESLLDELKIKHLRDSKAFQLSGGERRRLEITRALVTQPKFMMLDEPFAGVDPIAVDDIQKIVADLRHRGIGVLISDHNVEQTLDIVDRAYIMYDGQVKYAGTVRDLVFDDTVSRIYLGPTLTARLRDRFAHAADAPPAPLGAPVSIT